MLKNKNLKKILVVLIFLSVYFFTFSLALAIDPEIKLDASDLQVPIAGINFGANPGEWIQTYIAGIYKYGVGVAVFLAVVMIMAGGFMWLMSAGRPGQIQVAQDFIKSALLGLLLALFSYLLLYTVNPQLVALQPLQIDPVPPVSAE